MVIEEMPTEALASGETRAARKTFSTIGLALFAVALVTAGLQAALGFLSAYLTETESALADNEWFIWAITFIPLYLVGFPVGLLILKKLPVSDIKQIKLGSKNFWLFMLMCFPMMYFGNLIGTLLSYLVSGGTAENGLLDYVFDESILKILVIVFIAPLLEEYLFRKQIIDRCAIYGEKQAVLFSAVTFALFHGNLYQFFYAFGIGLLLGYVYMRTRKLHYSVIMHMVINFMGSVVAPIVASGFDEDAVNKIAAGQIDEAALITALPGLLGYMIYAMLLLGLSIAGLILIILKAKKLVFIKAENELPKGESFKSVYVNFGVISFILLCTGICVLSLI